MRLSSLVIPTFLVSTAVLVTGCTWQGTNPDPGSTDTSPPPVASPDPTDDSPKGDGPGRATVTVGGVTYDFASFRCAVGHDNTASDTYSFTSDARGESATGAVLQLQANVRDNSGLGRLEGDGVVYEISLQDTSNLANPSISFVATSEGFLGSAATIAIDDANVTATGLFLDDQRIGESPIAGSLEATCSEDSLW